jgi:hypothetical protein
MLESPIQLETTAAQVEAIGGVPWASRTKNVGMQTVHNVLAVLAVQYEASLPQYP